MEMLLNKRSTRGQRINALIGEAADGDEQFWGNEVWQSDDESFSEVEIEPDEFDSDFNDSEDEGEENSDDEEKSAKKGSRKERKSTNKYKEPGSTKRKAEVACVGADNEVPKKFIPRKVSRINSRGSIGADSIVLTGPREVRRSTKVKSEEAYKIHRKATALAQEAKVKFRPQIQHRFTQKGLLLDALDTEAQNKKWLEAQRIADFERAMSDKMVKPQQSRSFIRFVSRRGTYDTITFSDVDCMPSVFTSLSSSSSSSAATQRAREEDDGSGDHGNRKALRCVITGLPAKYRDPLTGLPYANVEAFREIRMRHKSGGVEV